MPPPSIEKYMQPIVEYQASQMKYRENRLPSTRLVCVCILEKLRIGREFDRLESACQCRRSNLEILRIQKIPRVVHVKLQLQLKICVIFSFCHRYLVVRVGGWDITFGGSHLYRRFGIAIFLQWEIFAAVPDDCIIFKVDIRAAKKPDKTRSSPVKIGTIFGKLMQSEKCLLLLPRVSCIVVHCRDGGCFGFYIFSIGKSSKR